MPPKDDSPERKNNIKQEISFEAQIKEENFVKEERGCQPLTFPEGKNILKQEISFEVHIKQEDFVKEERVCQPLTFIQNYIRREVIAFTEAPMVFIVPTYNDL